jgi:hypothetical protein
MNHRRLDRPCMNDPDFATAQKQVVALHEAAHAAVAFSLGYEPTAIELNIRCKLNSEGRAVFAYYGAVITPTPATLHDDATIAAAGPIAQGRWCNLFGLPDDFNRGGQGDFDAIAHSARKTGWAKPDMFQMLARARARAALNNPTVWRGVCRLAHALHVRYWPAARGPGEHKATMSGHGAEAILRRAGVRPGMLGARDLGPQVEALCNRPHRYNHP